MALKYNIYNINFFFSIFLNKITDFLIFVNIEWLLLTIGSPRSRGKFVNRMGQSIHKEKYAFRKVMLYGVQVHLPILSYKCWLVLYLKDVPKYLGRPIQCHVVCAMDGTSEDHIITAVSRTRIHV